MWAADAAWGSQAASRWARMVWGHSAMAATTPARRRPSQAAALSTLATHVAAAAAAAAAGWAEEAAEGAQAASAGRWARMVWGQSVMTAATPHEKSSAAREGSLTVYTTAGTRRATAPTCSLVAASW
mmetsp:Transcript_51885/g.135386  ORF Transcript_51885/g.135386 Transcript_51885/m.135386 type:complete len:127 (-) Transcript_51885:373-753(-)